MGTFYSGIKANSLDIAPNYAGVIMAIANGTGSLAGVIGPYIVISLYYNRTVNGTIIDRNLFMILLCYRSVF